MTREEALAILKTLDRIGANTISANDEETLRYNDESRLALEIAIMALEQFPDAIHNEREQAYMKGYEDASKRYRKEPCEDAISREPFTDSTICEGFSCNECSFNRKDNGGCILEERVKALPSIQPKQKIGHWIKYGVPRCEEQHYQCTSCGYYINFGQWGELYTKEFKYCPNCGAKMVEGSEEE